MPIKSIIKQLLYALCLTVLGWSSTVNANTPLPEADGLIHLGVASCASSVCHGKTSPQKTTTVLQNEYSTWTQHDRHARAYKTLLSDDSKRIAKLLDIGPASEAKVCLDCHSDNVNDGLRGRRFQRSDGVGCEACHGGAEKWIKSHTEPNATHAQNIEFGLYPTDIPAERAKLCMSCHVGNEDKFASHDIMGAGHPRLSFELDTFTVIQPKHYVVDDDYIKRKGDYTGLKIWLAGQLMVADHWLDLIESPKFQGDGLFPEISFYDCHSCHHAMSDERKQSGLISRPGDLRLNDAYLQIIEAILSVVSEQALKSWKQNSLAFVRFGHTDKEKLFTTVKQLRKTLSTLKPKLEYGLSKEQQKELLSELIALGLERRVLDYTSCEQVVMGITVIVDSLNLNRSLGGKIDRLYDSLAKEDSFESGKYTKALRSFSKSFEALKL
tara:strand:- start:9064 stop:10380 length:1317 start_codon:yes stop_codon:yes gene_type:complete